VKQNAFHSSHGYKVTELRHHNISSQRLKSFCDFGLGLGSGLTAADENEDGKIKSNLCIFLL
jgi:hypothetical protein